jgi:hypothetical protein
MESVAISESQFAEWPVRRAAAPFVGAYDERSLLQHTR